MIILILGGYGNFGARVCRALADGPSGGPVEGTVSRLLIGGRDLRRARALVTELRERGAAHETIEAVVLDHGAPGLAGTLRRLGVDLLIHAAGPFQQQAYGVARAAAEAGAHYIDLSDGRRFVCDFPAALDAAFRAAGRTAISGASTVPALSSAVVEYLCAGWSRIDAIDICIAPAQTAPRGQATLEAVLSYCGAPIQVWDRGQWRTLRGWARPTPVRFARLRPRLGALCDIPDLELFPTRYRVTRRVLFQAAVEVALAQRAFALLAALTSVGLVARPARFAGIMNSAARVFDRLGSSLGGMVVHVEGSDADGRPARRAWHIAADHDHGPEIPCMAAILLARRLARGDAVPVGAHACMGMLTLADFAPEFARWGMVTDIVDEAGDHGA